MAQKLTVNTEGFRGAHVLCAVSGGADSVALLCLLAEERDKGFVRLSAAHFEHGIRGEASLEDMRFTQSLCAELNVPLYTGSANVPREAERLGLGLEECARVLRHEFLRKTLTEAGADYIALAHHRRDRAETVLMHLLRGGGTGGAGCMNEKEGVLLRPLIDTEPEALREYLTAAGRTWREDATNFVADNPRNALRLEVFPALKRIYPGFEKALARFAVISAGEDAYMADVTDEFIRTRVRKYCGIRIITKDAPLPVLRRAVRRFLPYESSFDDTERARLAKGFCDTGEGCRAYGDDENIYILPRASLPLPAAVDIGGVTALEGICTLRSEISPAVPVRNNGPVQVLAADAVCGCVLRLRKDRDRIRPLGMKGQSRLLSDVLTDRKIPLPLRERLPVIARENEIIWACGACVSETARVIPGINALRLTIDTEV